jgi:hypothetical protein
MNDGSRWCWRKRFWWMVVDRMSPDAEEPTVRPCRLTEQGLNPDSLRASRAAVALMATQRGRAGSPISGNLGVRLDERPNAPNCLGPVLPMDSRSSSPRATYILITTLTTYKASGSSSRHICLRSFSIHAQHRLLNVSGSLNEQQVDLRRLPHHMHIICQRNSVDPPR